MHSKWQIWDFFSSVRKDFLTEFEGVLALNTFDPICLKMAKDYLTRGMGSRVLHYKMAAEVNKGWIEEEFQTLSFFGGQDNFFIHQAQDLPADVLELIHKLELQGRFILLSFESENAAWKKIAKEGSVETLQVEPPKFWEPNKLLDFVCTYLRLPLSYESKSWMLEALENNLPTFYNSASLIKLNHPEAAEVTLTQVKELLTLEKLDQFAFASLYARRRPQEFFERLIPLLGDFERMRAFFNFLQSHLIKMMDPSYLAQKPRLTQYDKDLQNTSKLWKYQELVREVERFNRWELMCKKKESLLWHELKEAALV